MEKTDVLYLLNGIGLLLMLIAAGKMMELQSRKNRVIEELKDKLFEQLRQVAVWNVMRIKRNGQIQELATENRELKRRYGAAYFGFAQQPLERTGRKWLDCYLEQHELMDVETKPYGKGAI